MFSTVLLKVCKLVGNNFTHVIALKEKGNKWQQFHFIKYSFNIFIIHWDALFINLYNWILNFSTKGSNFIPDAPHVKKLCLHLTTNYELKFYRNILRMTEDRQQVLRVGCIDLHLQWIVISPLYYYCWIISYLYNIYIF